MDPDTDWRDHIIEITGVAILAGLIVLACCSCQTIQAVTAAPEEFWITLETILAALWADVLTVVDLVL